MELIPARVLESAVGKDIPVLEKIPVKDKVGFLFRKKIVTPKKEPLRNLNIS
ncbi:hypothetical protein LEP1GSC047_0196 [Leptospira inadai serovar Lyme str. 10]|uniref:Uncharacterized protein n=1 Tax=Leptospira inadai serovar Lyme str. 10 TaxID=1049790 RepID=V6HF71_9LEPT|nr:hypothetical protein LEP1GSC047_0196 [Leptospira inadai serovar Lyme str. 10]